MHWLHGMYVRWFNDRHARSGRLFEHRYECELVEDDLYFLTLIKYVEHNPVKPKLCAKPEDWPWSSRGIVATHGCPPWLADDVLSARRMAIADL